MAVGRDCDLLLLRRWPGVGCTDLRWAWGWQPFPQSKDLSFLVLKLFLLNQQEQDEGVRGGGVLLLRQNGKVVCETQLLPIDFSSIDDEC